MDIKQKVISTNVSSIGNNPNCNSFSSGHSGVSSGIGGGSSLKYSKGINISANSFEQNTTQGVFSIKKDHHEVSNTSTSGNVSSLKNGGNLGGVSNSFDSKQPFKSANIQK